ncbi:MAG: hypothetical protein VZS44_06265 [Bacilli bacterium]|nr:hypothetical protein [Bacilli bacterium]
MKYDPILEIISILNLDNNDQELIKFLKKLTKELNFKLGNIKNKSFDSYQKEIELDDKKRTIKIKKTNQNNQLEIIYQQNSNFINLKYDNYKTYLNKLNIMYPHGLYILDNKKNVINYYDRETINYVIEKEQKTKNTPFIELNDMTENGLQPEKIIKLPDNSLENIILFKKLITNTKEENEKEIEKIKGKKNKQKILNYK